MQPFTIVRAGLTVTLCAGALFLTACGGSSNSDTPPPATPDAEWNATNWNEGDWQ